MLYSLVRTLNRSSYIHKIHKQRREESKMEKYATQVGFHYSQEANQQAQLIIIGSEATQFDYTFENFFHPYVGELIELLNKRSLAGLLDPKEHQRLADKDKDFFTTYYTALWSDVVKFCDFPQKE